jgi:hypothetical protein
MASLINRVPIGLLSLLGIKALGDNPRELSNQVWPNLDLMPFYLAATTEVLNVNTLAVNANGFWGATAATTTNLKLWVVNSYTCRSVANLGAATSIRFRAAINDTTTNRIVSVSDALSVGAAGESPICGFSQRIVMLPGYQLGIWVEQIALGVAPTFQISLSYTELDV